MEAEYIVGRGISYGVVLVNAFPRDGWMMLDTSDDMLFTSMKMPKVGNLPSPTTALTRPKAKAAMLELNFILKNML